MEVAAPGGRFGQVQGMLQGFLGLRHLVFVLDALGDVHHHAIDFHRHALGIALQSRQVVHPHYLFVVRAQVGMHHVVTVRIAAQHFFVSSQGHGG